MGADRRGSALSGATRTTTRGIVTAAKSALTTSTTRAGGAFAIAGETRARTVSACSGAPWGTVDRTSESRARAPTTRRGCTTSRYARTTRRRGATADTARRGTTPAIRTRAPRTRSSTAARGTTRCAGSTRTRASWTRARGGPSVVIRSSHGRAPDPLGSPGASARPIAWPGAGMEVIRRPPANALRVCKSLQGRRLEIDRAFLRAAPGRLPRRTG